MISDANINTEMDAKINAGSFFQNRFGKWINYLSTGAGFLPSTVVVKSITLEIKSSIESIVPDDEISTLPKKCRQLAVSNHSRNSRLGLPWIAHAFLSICIN